MINSMMFLYDVESDVQYVRKAMFRCKCGNEKVMRIYNVKSGKTKTCGCTRSAAKTIHGHSVKENGKESSLYKRWHAMKYRCNNPNSVDYPRYGGRGITICEEWYDFTVFVKWAENVGYAPHLTLDRKNNNKGYNPNNCRWVTQNVQSANKNKGKGKQYKYIGVRQIQSGNWHATINSKSKRIAIGTFNTEMEAVIARDNYVKANKLPHTLNII